MGGKREETRAQRRRTSRHRDQWSERTIGDERCHHTPSFIKSTVSQTIQLRKRKRRENWFVFKFRFCSTIAHNMTFRILN